MKCLLLGEGKTDLGCNDDFANPRFKKGPMTLAIDALAAGKGIFGIDYKLLSRGDVSRGLKNMRRGIAPRPKAIDPDLRAVSQSAWFMGRVAIDGGRDMGVYFHDPDCTRSAPRDQARRLENAMNAGFALAGFRFGVPMIPVPRSEAWLLAYFQKGLETQSAYNKAERFEELPANDHSPKSAKKLLQKAVGANSESDIYSKVMDEIGNLDWTQVVMPSFSHFRDRLESVLESCK